MAGWNIISIVIFIILIVPVLYGFLNPVSKERMQYFIGSLFDSIEFMGALVLAIYLTGKIFFSNAVEGDMDVFSRIYLAIPEGIRNLLHGQNVLTYIFGVPVILLLLLIMIRVITTPLYRLIVEPCTGMVYNVIDKFGFFGRGVLGALWRLPKAISLILLLGIAVNFYSYYYYNPELTAMLNSSTVYQTLYKNAIAPVLNSNIAKKIPVLVNDSFSKAVPPEELPGKSAAEKLVNQLAGRNIKVIEYYNGVTLDEAIKSTPEIDQTAIQIVGNEKKDTKKAYSIYKWVSQNVSYDMEKADRLSKDPSGISSGSIVAFSTRKGVCFDYSSLYISMCRAVGLKVRLITGLGYSGITWGDHAWNQVYSEEEKRWINVDATFGSAANYFDKPDFHVDHKYAEIQGEW